MKKLLALFIVMCLFVIVIKKKIFKDFEYSTSNFVVQNCEIWPPSEESKLFCYNNAPPLLSNEALEEKSNKFLNKMMRLKN